MKQISIRALRTHWTSAAGVFLTMVLAAVLVSAAGTLMESGYRAEDRFSETATVLPAMMASFGGVAVMIAVFVVSTAFSATLRDRRREFALLRAVGATGRQVRSLVSTEVMLISAAGVFVGSVAGLVAARALVPLLRSSGIVEDGFQPTVSGWPLLATAALLLPAAWIAGVLAAREMARLSPTSAVGTSSTEVKRLSTGRIIAAWACFAGGAVATLSPLYVPGAMGGATGSASALLFIAAAALAGPALVSRSATWLSHRSLARRGGPLQLATVNARGYSRRLTAAVVPLALLVALGTVQTGMSHIVSTAATQQFTEAFAGDLVWVGDASEAELAREGLESLPGVEVTATTEVAVVHVRMDDDATGIDTNGLEWEPASVRMLDDPAGKVIDPAVTGGSLGDLSAPDTVAVASDTLGLAGKGLGDTIGVRYPDGTEAHPTIVAVFERGLGLGGLIVGSEAFEPAAIPGSPATIVVDAADGATGAVMEAAHTAGLELATVAHFVEASTKSSGASNQLSDTLLFALLAFIGIAAGNALVVATRSRRSEFVLLGKLGATRGQLRATLAIEAGLVAIGAVVLGTLMALPGLTAASLSLVHGLSLGLDGGVYAALVVAASLVACIGLVGARFKPATG